MPRYGVLGNYWCQRWENNRDFAYKLESELIERNYVAVNLIEVDDFLVVSAKKMHGWSGS